MTVILEEKIIPQTQLSLLVERSFFRSCLNLRELTQTVVLCCFVELQHYFSECTLGGETSFKLEKKNSKSCFSVWCLVTGRHCTHTDLVQVTRMLISVILSTGNSLIRVTIQMTLIKKTMNTILQYIWTEYNSSIYRHKHVSLWWLTWIIYFIYTDCTQVLTTVYKEGHTGKQRHTKVEIFSWFAIITWINKVTV